MERDVRVLDIVPGHSLGPFEIGMAEASLPGEFEYEVRPGASGLPDSLDVKGLPVQLCPETTETPGIDEIEVSAVGARARLRGVDLLGRPVADVLADLERAGVELPQEDPDDPDSYRARGWGFWLYEGDVASVLVERPEFFDDPPDLTGRMTV
jgi:hypothetical protein